MSNTTTITGNLTREPEIRYTREGQATAQLGVAVSRRWQDRTTQEWQEATSFFDVVCWRDLAENVALSLSKGMRVVVTGRIEQRSWETDEGEHRSKVEIVADEIGPILRFATADVRRVERRQEGRDQPPSQSGRYYSRRSRSSNSPGPAGAVARPGPGAVRLGPSRSGVCCLGSGRTVPPKARRRRPQSLTIRSQLPHDLTPTLSPPSSSPSCQTTTLAASATSVCFTRVAFEGESGIARGGRWWSSAVLRGAGRGPSRRGEQAVISLRRMTLGSGYRYLMESVAVGDGAPGHTSNLTRYYASRGPRPACSWALAWAASTTAAGSSRVRR